MSITSTFQAAWLHISSYDSGEADRVTIVPTSRKPLPQDVYDDTVTLCDGDGNIYLTKVLDFHDGYEHGGEPSFVWLELK